MTIQINFMDIVICFKNKSEDSWLNALRKALPDIGVYKDGNVPDRSKVGVALCWYPQKDLLLDYPNLKLIQSVGAGVDHLLDLDPMSSAVKIARIVDPALSRDMFEFSLAVVLAQMKNLSTYLGDKGSKHWNPIGYQRINQVTIAVLGLGKIGSELASSFAELGFKVNGFANSPKQLNKVSCFSGEEGLERAVSTADYIINILPLTTSTEGFYNTAFFDKCKQGAFFINVGRGGHLMEHDLLQALESEKLSGAYLDVFRKEPLPKEHPFWAYQGIQISPHVAAVTNSKTALTQIVDNYRRTMNNEALLNEVSIVKGY